MVLPALKALWNKAAPAAAAAALAAAVALSGCYYPAAGRGHHRGDAAHVGGGPRGGSAYGQDARAGYARDGGPCRRDDRQRSGPERARGCGEDDRDWGGGAPRDGGGPTRGGRR
jgi:hypothetical protein